MDSKNVLNLIIYCFVVSLSTCASAKKEMNHPVVNKTILLDASKEQVWSALTNEDELNQWWGPGVKLEAKIGGAFYEPWGDGQLATGKVVDLDKFNFIRFTWHEKYWESDQDTICVFSVVRKDGATHLTVHQSGWEVFNDPQNMVEGFEKGWDFILFKLKKHLEDK